MRSEARQGDVALERAVSQLTGLTIPVIVKADYGRYWPFVIFCSMSGLGFWLFLILAKENFEKVGPSPGTTYWVLR